MKTILMRLSKLERHNAPQVVDGLTLADILRARRQRRCALAGVPFQEPVPDPSIYASGRRLTLAEASKETVRKWMMRAKLWRGKKARVRELHVWRPRRSRFGELVQWDTSDHDWLEGRGERLYLIAMIDDATSRLFARFVKSDSTEENMRVLWSYLEKFGPAIELVHG